MKEGLTTMSNFSYEEYLAQQASRPASNNTNSGTRTNVHYLNEFLRNDGDTVIVRFPYRSTADFTFESTHAVTFPGKTYPSRVRCQGSDCPFCKEGKKQDIRFYVKCLVYVVDDATGTVKGVPAVWDRPAAYADIELKALLQEYGDLSAQLFKIRRNGMGMQTRYTSTIILNNAVYNPETYKADFTELNTVDAVKLCTKSLTEKPAKDQSAPANEPVVQPAAPQPAYVAAPQQPINPGAVKQQFAGYQPPVNAATQPAAPVYATPETPTYAAPAAAPAQPVNVVDADATRRRYTF